ncbi:MAG: 16S rRNA (guanine(527)-N(7))-methyltransferase RsmG [Silvibacterium sp.]|nr:16S rRNA (guanine(527)-N(7))-methyltransferase RsmG [Silvibacterium sp.]
MAASPHTGVGDRVTAAEIENAVSAAGLNPLRPGASDLFAGYLDLLIHWNTKLNLTAVREPSQIVQRHLVECIQCGQALPEVQTLLDFGSGAGLPGIPIAIARPEIKVTLGESQGKKAAFLREVIRVLGLNTDVHDQRIEKMPAGRAFDAVTLRAVDRMEEVARLGLQRVRPGGWLVLFATAATREQLQGSIDNLDWERQIPTSGLETGILLFGRRSCST